MIPQSLAAPATLAPIGQRSFSRVCATRRLASITTLLVRTFCGMLKKALERGHPHGEQINRVAALSLKRGESVDFGGYWQRIRNKLMPEQKLHTHEEVYKDHVAGQYDESIYRLRVPSGWIYTHTIIRFGSVDKNFIADTFVPDSK
jgi:hypothetical protein